MVFKVVYAFSAALIIFGILGAILMGQGMSLYLRSGKWTKTTATVLSLHLTDSSRYDSEYGSTSHSYKCTLTYRYTVNYTDYDGHQASMFWRHGSNSLCYRLAQKYGHDEVPVYYDPKHPGRSLLDRTFQQQELMKISVASFSGYAAGSALLASNQVPYPAFALCGVYAGWCAMSLFWGYGQTASKFVFAAFFSFLVACLFAAIAVACLIFACSNGFDTARAHAEALAEDADEDEESGLNASQTNTSGYQATDTRTPL